MVLFCLIVAAYTSQSGFGGVKEYIRLLSIVWRRETLNLHFTSAVLYKHHSVSCEGKSKGSIGPGPINILSR